MDATIIYQELQFKAVRSSGAGGQHVNKVSSKVELCFEIGTSMGLTDQEKERLITQLKTRLTKNDVLILSCQESRSQHRNKELITKRFFNLIEQKLVLPKIRKKTKPSKLAHKKRLNAKKRLSEKKENRKKPTF